MLTWEIPDTKGIVMPALEFNTSYSCYSLFLNGDEIASYGEPSTAEKKVTPKKIEFIQLPEDCAHQKLEILVTATSDVRFTCSSFYFGDMEDLHIHYMQNRRLPIFVGGFLVIFGLLLSITIPFIKGISTKNRSILFHGPAILDLGLYILCYNQMMRLFVASPSLCVYIEHITLYLFPFFLQCIISFAEEETKKSDTILLAIDFAFPISALVPSMTGGAYISDVLYVAHVMMVLQSIIVIRKFVIYQNKLKTTSQDHYLYNGTIATLTVMVGILVLIASALLEMVIWYLPSVIGLTINSILRGSLLMYGALFLTACMIASYFYYLVAGQNEETIEKELEGIAYEDELTSLSNRAYCQQQMELMRRNKKKCTIISFDMDGLKQANDILGHQIGDRMIRDFAAVLKETYAGDALLCGRMGGDEFIVALEDESEDYCRETISRFKLNLGKKNDTLREYYLKASWGYAFLHEVKDFDTRACYMLADERMYEMKKMHKGVKA